MAADSVAMPIYSSKEPAGSRADFESMNKENENNTNKKSAWQRFPTRQGTTMAGNEAMLKPSVNHEQVIRLIRN